MSETLAASVDRLAEQAAFAGVVRIDDSDGELLSRAYGLADRSWGIANTVETRFAIASGTKGLTALTLASLLDDEGVLLSTSARSLLQKDLPLISEDVTVEHLLAHRSGIGDYLDEETLQDLNDYAMPVPVHELATTEQYLRVLDGHRTLFKPGEQFRYCNSGYVVLALIAERISATPFHDLVRQRVCTPAAMVDTEFLRSDELPAQAARGYLEAAGLRTNILHLPVRGSGDGGVYSTAADIRALWTALFAGRIVSDERVAEFVRPRSLLASGGRRYGLGFWVHPTTATVMLEGSDAGVSFRSVHDPSRGLTHTVISNTTRGAWPIARHLDERLTA